MICSKITFLIFSTLYSKKLVLGSEEEEGLVSWRHVGRGNMRKVFALLFTPHSLVLGVSDSENGVEASVLHQELCLLLGTQRKIKPCRMDYLAGCHALQVLNEQHLLSWNGRCMFLVFHSSEGWL